MELTEYLRKIPLVRIVVPFIIGIILQVSFSLVTPFLHVYLLVLVALIMLILLLGLLSTRWFNGVLIFLMCVIGGIEITYLQYEKDDNLYEGHAFIISDILEEVSLKEKTVKATIEIKAVKQNEEWTETSGKAVVYFERDSMSENLMPGDRIAFEPSFNLIQNAGNPNEFDYKKYMAFHMISKQAYMKSDSWTKVGVNDDLLLKRISSRIRSNLIQIYESSGIEGDELAVLCALTLGYKDKLEASVKKSFAGSGATHILAVSGLHVGVVYLILNGFLFFFDKKKIYRFVKALIILSSIWFFALITGLSPSVMRAATMFSFIVVGQNIGRETNIYNTLSASALLLLIINPYLVKEVGFQLSYLAVIGIVYFQPKIYNLFFIRNKIMDRIWALVSVSIAAQLVTFPLGLYYFHQFPNYFLLTNILVIPFASILIYEAILLFVFSFSTGLSLLIGKVLKFTVWMLNQSVKMIDGLPYSTISDVTISGTQLMLIYLLIIALAIFFIYKRGLALMISICFFCAIFGLSLARNYYQLHQNMVIVYNIRGVSAINFIDGRDNILFAGVDKEEIDNLHYHVKNNWIKMGVENEKIIPLSKLSSQYYFSNFMTLDNQNIFYKHNIINFKGETFFVVRNLKDLPSMEKEILSVDYVILAENPGVKIEELLKRVTCNMIIIDSSNNRWKKDRWITECSNLSVDCFPIEDNGAFVLKF